MRQSVPSTPDWFGEVTVMAHYLAHLGILSANEGLCIPWVGEHLRKANAKIYTL